MIRRFGRFSIDPDRLELSEDGAPVAVEPQVFSLLAFLIENRDRVLSKDEIIENVWRGRIVSDGTLNSRINAARRAIGDNGTDQAVIKTYARRGFRFVAEIEGEEEAISPARLPNPAHPSRPSIAVLPFDNMSDDPEQEHFSDGITEDIITALSRIRQFFVIARTTTFTYKGRAADVRAIASDLSVRYVLEGSVRKAGDQVRISAQLIDGESGKHIWAERYDRELGDIFAVQDEITRKVTAAIEPELDEAERSRAALKPPDSLDAWELYQKGSFHIYDEDVHGDITNLERAAICFRQAIELDPRFSRAYSDSLARPSELPAGDELSSKRGVSTAPQATAKKSASTRC